MSARREVASAGIAMVALAAGLMAGSGASGPAPETSGPGGAAGSGVPGDAGTALPMSADDVLTDAMTAVIAGTLDGREVAIVALGDAGVPTAAVAAADVHAAGGRVVTQVTLGEDWADPGALELRDGLARQLGAGVGAEADADALVGLLAAALRGTPEQPAPGSTRSTVWGVLTGAGLVAGALDPGARPTAVVLTAPASVAVDALDGWTSLVVGLAATTPVVLAQPGAADPDAAGDPPGASLVVAVRDSFDEDRPPAALSTVDHAGTGLGRVALVRAAAGLPDGESGHYGSQRGAESGAPDRS